MMENKETQPPAHSMTSPTACYYSGCTSTPKWGISSSVEKREMCGAPLTLFACDDHQGELTKKMMDAGTRYSLFPVSGPHMVPPCECAGPSAEEVFEREVANMPPIQRTMLNVACVVVGLMVAPFFIAYYGGRWVLGWRP